MAKVFLSFCKRHGMSEHVYSEKTKRVACRLCRQEITTKRRRDIKMRLVEYKGGECVICGYNKCLDALEFHHIDPTTKDVTISTSSKGFCSFEKLKNEVDKCILVCSNCHRELHHKQNKENQRLKNLQYIQSVEEYKNTVDVDIKRHNRQKILDIDNIKCDIEEGLTQAQISQKYSVSVSTLKRFLCLNNISMSLRRINMTKEEFTEYMNTHSVNDFLKEFNVTRKTYDKWKKRYK